MPFPPQIEREPMFDKARAWLKSDVTVTLPGWAFAGAGAVALVLLIVALD